MAHVGVTATTWDMYDTYDKETEASGEIDDLAGCHKDSNSMPNTDSKNAKLNLESNKPNPFCKFYLHEIVLLFLILSKNILLLTLLKFYW